MAGNNWDDLANWARKQRDGKDKTAGDGKDKTAGGGNPPDRGGRPQGQPPTSGAPLTQPTSGAPTTSPSPQNPPYRPDSPSAPPPPTAKGALRDRYVAARESGREQLRGRASDMVADKIGIDRDVARALSSSRDAQGRPVTAGRRVQAAANAGVTAGLTAIGVPPQLAQRISPYVLKVTAVIVAFSLLILIGLVGGVGFGSGRDPIASNDAYEAIDEQLRREVGSAATTYRVPSRLLLAIAGVQTSYGRYSPYDDIDRDPARPGTGIVEKKGGQGMQVEVFPEVKPAIGNPKNPDEGVGMYLVRPGAAQRAGVNPQDVRRTTRWLAMLMREEADRLRKSGQVEPDPRSTNFAQADEFWGRVVGALPLVDVFGQSIGCAAPAGETRVDAVISSLWTCELDRVTDVAIPTVTLAGDTPVLSYDTNGRATTRLVREALGVAWQWGQLRRPGATTWQEISELPCNEGAALAGVFPIDRATARQLGLQSRCDAAELVGAVARAVISKLKQGEGAVVLDQARPWAVEATGWDVVPWALGSEATATLFAEQGPQKAYEPNTQCRNASYDYLAALSRNPALREPFLVAASASDDDRPARLREIRRLLLTTGNGNPYGDPRCSVLRRVPTESEWLTYIAALAGQMYNVINEGRLAGSSTSLLPEASVMFVISELGGSGTMTGLVSAVPGRDAAVERLSPTPIVIDMPPAEASLASSAFSLWNRVLNEALRIGGLLPDDPRSGMTGAAGGIGIAIRRVEPTSLKVIEKFSDGGLVEGMRCANYEHTPVMTNEYAARWSALCNAATAAGVQLATTSSWRSNAEQIYLRGIYGPSLVAEPGTSNHQKGYALDIDIHMTKEDHIGSESPSFAFMHSVVGCLDTEAKSFSAFSQSMLVEDYVSKLDAGTPPCKGALLPIKRIQTFGLVPLCTVHNGEDWGDRDVLLCSKKQNLKGSNMKREAWHLDFGVIFLQTGFSADCSGTVAINPTDKRSVALAIKTVWLCELQANGFGSIAPVDGPRYPASRYFANLAEQVSSEALVVAYCESGFNAASGDKYVGVFQMGELEMESYGGGGSRVDALANIRAAARYFVASYTNNQGRGWAGWGPWAVVNTNYWETNRGVLRPVIGRFPSTRPDTKGQYGPDLPNWAVDPAQFWSPQSGCGKAYAGEPWLPAPASPLTR